MLGPFYIRSIFFILTAALLRALRISLMPSFSRRVFGNITFCFCAVSPTPRSFVTCSWRIELSGSMDCSGPGEAPSLVRGAFLFALGVTDLRWWCRLKLKWIAKMRPQRQKDKQVAKGLEGQFDHCWLQDYWFAEINPIAAESSCFVKLLDPELS